MLVATTSNLGMFVVEALSFLVSDALDLVMFGSLGFNGLPLDLVAITTVVSTRLKLYTFKSVDIHMAKTILRDSGSPLDCGKRCLLANLIRKIESERVLEPNYLWRKPYDTDQHQLLIYLFRQLYLMYSVYS